MFGFKKADQQPLINYKKARQEPNTIAYQEKQRQLTIKDIHNLPLLLDSSNIAKTYETMFSAYQLINYIQYVQKVENQEFFPIVFDPKPLENTYGVENPYFECRDHDNQMHMRLKKPLIEIPHEVWVQFQTVQYSSFEKKFHHYDSNSTLDIRQVFIPANDVFPYEWHKSTPVNQKKYDLELRSLFNLAMMVVENETTLYKARINEFNAATEQLIKISSDQPGYRGILFRMNEKMIALSKERSEPLDNLVVIINKTVALLDNRITPEEYNVVINNARGHGIQVSPEMQELCRDLLRLSALVVSLGIGIAAMAPTLAIAAGVTSAVTSSMLLATASYAFFNNKQKPATDLALDMEDIARSKVEPPPII